jgi:iron complex transport system substrate-binding protein
MNCIFSTTRHGLCVLGLVAALAAPAMAEATVTDATGRTINVRDASRIVSIGGAVTEILYALGHARDIVGVDSTSVFPIQAMKEKANVGYMRQLSAEGVLGLNPSVMIAIAGSGPKETMTVLEAAKVPLVIVPDSYSEAGIVEKINVIAKVTGATARAQCLTAQVHDDLAALAKIRAGIGEKKRVLFVLSFVSGRAMAAGTHTAADGILKLAGATNVVSEYEGYKPLNDEAVIAARPDVIVSIQRGGPGVLDEATVFAHPAFAATPAAARRAFVAMEGLYLLGFGPRTARAARDLAQTLYPDLKGAPLPSEKANGNGACLE